MKAKRIAADANFALDVAAQESLAGNALAVLRERFSDSLIIVPPTALNELAWLADGAEDADTRRHALQSLRSFGVKGTPWHPVPVLPEGIMAADDLAAGIHRRTGVPITEHDDALILAEATLLGCGLLVTSDRHLLDIEHEQLAWLMESEGHRAPLIVSPRELVRKFFR